MIGTGYKLLDTLDDSSTIIIRDMTQFGHRTLVFVFRSSGSDRRNGERAVEER